MAGALVRGDPNVVAAFKDAPFPIQEEPSLAAAADWSDIQKLLAPQRQPRSRHEKAARATLDLLAHQRLRLARTRLLIAGGAPDVGKTTILREVFGFEHFSSGLGRSGQTDQITFALHPNGDETLRPIYAVDTPGFGDGDQVHRNDMCGCSRALARGFLAE
eukprot:SRR837773.15192.p2 GENE.SRR837773.15192~~SRR837773.15192.p2  ORF type:complete len:183 (-),score=66.57 SRR837773.15192:421-903(-)